MDDLRGKEQRQGQPSFFAWNNACCEIGCLCSCSRSKRQGKPLSKDSDEPGLSVIGTFWSKKVGSSTSRIEKPAYDQNRIGTKGIYIQNSFMLFAWKQFLIT